MAVSSPPTSYELSEYGRVCDGRWWVVLLVTLIGVGVAGATSPSPTRRTQPMCSYR